MKNKLPWFLLASIVGYSLMRRQGKRGGATDEEVYAALPGDDVIPHPMVETTHAISIDAPPSRVWKWLIQAGFRGSGRAGWYSDSWIDKLNEKDTRLILRTRARYGPPLFRKVFLPLAYLAESVIPGKILRGIKTRAELPYLESS